MKRRSLFGEVRWLEAGRQCYNAVLPAGQRRLRQMRADPAQAGRPAPSPGHTPSSAGLPSRPCGSAMAFPSTPLTTRWSPMALAPGRTRSSTPAWCTAPPPADAHRVPTERGSTTTSGVGTASAAKALPGGSRATAIRPAGDASRPARAQAGSTQASHSTRRVRGRCCPEAWVSPVPECV